MKRFLILLFISFFIFELWAGVTPALIKIYDESEIAGLIEAGVDIQRRRGNLLLCYYPSFDDDTEIFVNRETAEGIPSTRDDFQSSQLDKKFYLKNKKRPIITPTLDKAIGYFNAFQIQEGSVFNSPLTGKGVVVGLCDIGLDPLHPVFLDKNGKSRIKRITQYKEYEGIRIVLEGDNDYKAWQTDTVAEYHATHVAGIMAGNGGSTPYKGIAPDADIVASLSGLTEFGLLMGVEDIIDYAKEVGKPAVINLSMGSYIGAHDGTSLFSQYLDLCADDAIFVLSAGNEGKRNNYLTSRFDNPDQTVAFKLANRSMNQRDMQGITDIFSDFSRPLKITIGIFQDDIKEIVYEYPTLLLQDGETAYIEWDSTNPDFPGLEIDGYMYLIGDINPENDRYELMLLYDYESKHLIGTGWARDLVTVRLEGEAGQEFEVFADGSHTRLVAVSGNPAPTTDMSISDLVCGHRIISVGMYGNRENSPNTIFDNDRNPVGEDLKASNYTPLQTVEHSSYATLRDGRALPMTVAPGIPVVSATSKYYFPNRPDEDYYIDKDGSLWMAVGGTSMSSPYVAGYIATWLEALPDLKTEDVIKLIQDTNIHDIPDPDNPRNINGFFNPVGALRTALSENGVTQIQNPAPIIMPADKIEVFSPTGHRVYKGRADGCNDIPKGFYIIKTPYGSIKASLPGLFKF